MRSLFLFGCFVCLYAEVIDDTLKCYNHNEELKCTVPCPPEKTCRNKDIRFRCALSDEKCRLTCVCKEGFYRNAIGDCITEEMCDQCRGPNEFYSCGGACDNVCSELHIQNQTSCPIVNFKCNEKCYCEEGYARNGQNECIPMEQCHN